MKQIAAAFLLAGTGMLAGAQTADLITRPGAIDAERSRIETERARLEAGFLTEDVACYKRFAVNSCLEKVNAKRREAMADLRRQEISLNDEDRKIRGAEQLRKTEEKSSPEKQQEAADNRAKALEDYQARLDRDKKKQEEKGTAASSAKSNSEASADRLKGNQQKAQTRTDKQATAAEEARKYNERQKEAQERRAQHEKDALNRLKPPAKGLPPPQ